MITRVRRSMCFVRAPGRRVVMAVVPALLGAVGSAQPVVQTDDIKIEYSGSLATDRFGQAVALSGDVAVFGAPFADGVFANTGAAYIYRGSGGSWSQELSISLASGVGKDDWLGASVAADGDWVAVGAPQGNTSFIDDGSVYMYFYDSLNGWAQTQKLVAPDAATGAKFGSAVEIDGDVLVVGATGADSSGSAYIFRFDGTQWVYEAELHETGAAAGAAFGTGIAVSGDTVLVGAPLEAGGGAVYVYQASGSVWTNTATLAASDNGGDDQFGYAVAFDGDNALVSAHLQDQNGGAVANTGAAYVFGFDGSSWTEDAKLTAEDDSSAQANFGFSLDLDGETAVIGAFQANTAAAQLTGAAYVFRFDGTVWNRDITLVSADIVAGDLFGYGLDGCDTVVVGAPGDEPDGSSQDRFGSVSVFTLPPAGPVDTDGDGISDDDEISLYGTDPLNPDSDADGLTDADEVFTYGTDPLAADTDGDLLTDLEEVDLADFGGCPDPLVFDSDADGIGDGEEVTLGLEPCDADLDDDGLTDGLELSYGTDPLTADTDGDGLYDGTEVDMAQGSGCPDPLLADSDGDGLTDGEEVDLGTSLCSTDTDGDGVGDAEDDQPTVPGVSSGYIEDALRDLAQQIRGMPLDSFNGPHHNGGRGRRAALSHTVLRVARHVSRGRYRLAHFTIERVLIPRVDGARRPSDWMADGADREAVYNDLVTLGELIGLLVDEDDGTHNGGGHGGC